MNRRWISVLCILLMCFNLLAEQADEEHTPEPYTREEFPDWLHNLRRFEIITLGTLPFTFLLSFLVYDLGRYAASGYDSNYRPISNPNPVPYTAGEQVGIVLAACTTSVLIALADYLIGRAREGRQKSASDEAQTSQ